MGAQSGSMGGGMGAPVRSLSCRRADDSAHFADSMRLGRRAPVAGDHELRDDDDDDTVSASLCPPPGPQPTRQPAAFRKSTCRQLTVHCSGNVAALLQLMQLCFRLELFPSACPGWSTELSSCGAVAWFCSRAREAGRSAAVRSSLFNSDGEIKVIKMTFIFFV